MSHQPTHYRGRFAPSPTGLLHLGSLLTAVASYVDAKANNGTWLVRMEDLDPPREMVGAADDILETLHRYGLHWDEPVLYQSQRQAIYQHHIDRLLQSRHGFYCTCSRSEIQARSGSARYPGTCRQCHTLPQQPHGIRVKVDDSVIAFQDQIQGLQKQNLTQHSGDFIIKRKDNLFAYHLAVVVDDDLQKITHVVRGCDLLDSTFCHLHLQNLLGFHHPSYSHLPIIVNRQKQKLSKQTYAEAIPKQQQYRLLLDCLIRLGQHPPNSLRGASADHILQWAIEHWKPEHIPKVRQLDLCIEP